MNKDKIGHLFLIIAAAIAIFTALAHMSCIFLGESCYRAQLAPEVIIQSAANASLLAPVATTFVSSLFLLCAVYALAAANLCTICRKNDNETSPIKNCNLYNFYCVYFERASHNSTMAGLPRNV